MPDRLYADMSAIQIDMRIQRKRALIKEIDLEIEELENELAARRHGCWLGDEVEFEITATSDHSPNLKASIRGVVTKLHWNYVGVNRIYENGEVGEYTYQLWSDDKLLKSPIKLVKKGPTP